MYSSHVLFTLFTLSSPCAHRLPLTLCPFYSSSLFRLIRTCTSNTKMSLVSNPDEDFCPRHPCVGRLLTRVSKRSLAGWRIKMWTTGCQRSDQEVHHKCRTSVLQQRRVEQLGAAITAVAPPRGPTLDTQPPRCKQRAGTGRWLPSFSEGRSSARVERHRWLRIIWTPCSRLPLQVFVVEPKALARTSRGLQVSIGGTSREPE